MGNTLGLVLLLCLLFQDIHVKGVDISYLRTTLTDHFSETRHHVANPAYKKKAKEFIFNEFKKFGLNPEYHNFTMVDDPLAQNVVGVLKGTNFGNFNDSILGIGAHYDTVITTKGVDDNGAGVAAMLEVARQLTDMNSKGTTRKNTIVFASFDHEENGLVGSEQFIATWLQPWLTSNYGSTWSTDMAPSQGVVILDTVMEYNTSQNSQIIPGNPAFFPIAFPDAAESAANDSYRGDFLAMIYRGTDVDDSQLASNLSTVWQTAGSPKFELEKFPLPELTNETIFAFGDFLRSDHSNFWNANIPAIFLTDSANFRGDMINCYHQPCDNLEVMLTEDNIQFLGKTADALTSTLHKMSEPTAGPTGNSMRITSQTMVLLLTVIVTTTATF